MPESNKQIQQGETASDFTLKDQNRQDFKLSDVKNKKILLSFHPLAWTSVCAKQMQSLEANIDTFASLNTIAVGISVDSVPTKKSWAENLGIKHTQLLSDFWPHGYVAQLYGIFREDDGFSERVNIIIDENNKIMFSKVYPLGELPDIQEIIQVLENI
ncbi:MAG: redoxin domain-containing protein [Dehalococcoidales bacterium]|nr:redoxin domain-containing protein [Dehalococcoidales bacterium]